jgi:hypothetical protein
LRDDKRERAQESEKVEAAVTQVLSAPALMRERKVGYFPLDPFHLLFSLDLLNYYAMATEKVNGSISPVSHRNSTFLSPLHKGNSLYGL